MSASSFASTLPELLAPAGDWDALRAAVANGANAVYFGLSNFNARYRATNFTLEELPEVMAYLHRHNVRGYIAFNTLIFSDELPSAVEFITAIVSAGADAVIVQDFGLVELIRRVAPNLAIHGSTQMSLTEARGIEFVRSLGVERVIVARELSVDEISKIAAATPMPLEVFVHGALCVAYSGQCLTSESLGGRSANRGQCAQACRLPYDLIVDGKYRDNADRQYLLSPQDLAAHELIAPMVKLGVRSFKIEGRLKSAEYVAITSQTYRRAIDAAVQAEPFALDRQSELDLQQSFSRGFSHGFLSGINHQTLVPGRFPKSRGVRVGIVANVTSRGVLVQLDATHDQEILQPGDGVVFDDGHPEQDEQGGRLVEVRKLSEPSPLGRGQGEGAGNTSATPRQHPHPNPLPKGEGAIVKAVELIFFGGSVNLAAVSRGNLVWKTDDPQLRRRMGQTFSRDTVVHREPVSFSIHGELGGQVTLKVSDSNQNIGRAEWPGPLETARKHATTLEILREQFDRLGDTPFELADVQTELPPNVMLPKSVLNDLRRQAIEALQTAREAKVDHTLNPASLEQLRAEIKSHEPSPNDQPPALYVLARTMDQLDALLAWQSKSPQQENPKLGAAMIYCDFEDVRRYREAVQKAKAANVPLGVATLRIIKPAEEGLLRIIAKAEPDAVLIRNLAGLAFFSAELPHCKKIADFSLNIANELTANLFRTHGCERLTPGYDLNWEQLAAMLGRIEPALFEVVVHQHMPMFHMEHCVFAAMLSNGKDSTDCGRPCDRHRVELRDRVGAEFPLLADTGCRNTVFNSVAQSAAEYIPKMLSLGVRHFRVELLRETAAEVQPLVEHYARLIAGLESSKQTWRGLQVLNQLGVTRGTLQLA